MRVAGLDLHLRPQSFFQTNTAMAGELYQRARAWTADLEPASVWDLYCGVGGFALSLARPGVAVTASSDGAVTLDEGLARFDCTVYREVEAGDHTIVLLELHAVEHADTSSPLVFHRSGFGRLVEAG